MCQSAKILYLSYRLQRRYVLIDEYENAASCWKAILSDVSKNRKLLSVIESFARENIAPATVVFGPPDGGERSAPTLLLTIFEL